MTVRSWIALCLAYVWRARVKRTARGLVTDSRAERELSRGQSATEGKYQNTLRPSSLGSRTTRLYTARVCCAMRPQS